MDVSQQQMPGEAPKPGTIDQLILSFMMQRVFAEQCIEVLQLAKEAEALKQENDMLRKQYIQRLEQVNGPFDETVDRTVDTDTQQGVK